MDTDLTVDVRSGELTLAGSDTNLLSCALVGLTTRFHSSDVATFFEPTLVAIQQAIVEQKAAARVPITVRIPLPPEAQLI